MTRDEARAIPEDYLRQHPEFGLAHRHLHDPVKLALPVKALAPCILVRLRRQGQAVGSPIRQTTLPM